MAKKAAAKRKASPKQATVKKKAPAKKAAAKKKGTTNPVFSVKVSSQHEACESVASDRQGRELRQVYRHVPPVVALRLATAPPIRRPATR